MSSCFPPFSDFSFETLAGGYCNYGENNRDSEPESGGTGNGSPPSTRDQLCDALLHSHANSLGVLAGKEVSDPSSATDSKNRRLRLVHFLKTGFGTSTCSSYTSNAAIHRIYSAGGQGSKAGPRPGQHLARSFLNQPEPSAVINETVMVSSMIVPLQTNGTAPLHTTPSITTTAVFNGLKKMPKFGNAFSGRRTVSSS